MFEGIGAELVWDGTDEIRIPERMSKPREGQMEGVIGPYYDERASGDGVRAVDQLTRPDDAGIPGA